MRPHRWLMKTEPETFSLDDLVASPEQTTMWEGVRNYTVRNWMRDDMAVGDEVLFYHSSCAIPGVVGLAEITRTAYPDPTQFDPASHYFDPKSDPADPRWLIPLVSTLTTPRSGLLCDSRFSSTLVSA